MNRLKIRSATTSSISTPLRRIRNVRRVRIDFIGRCKEVSVGASALFYFQFYSRFK